MQRRLRRPNRSVTGHRLGQQSRQAQFGEEVEAVVAGSAIGAKPDVDARPRERADWCKARRQFQVRGRAMRHMHPAPRQQFSIRRVEMDSMYGDEMRTQNTEALEAGQWPLTARRDGIAYFVRRLMNMAVHRQAFALGQRGDLHEQGIAHRIRRVRRQRKVRQRLAREFGARGQAAAHRCDGIRGIGRWKIDRYDARHRAYSGFHGCLANRFGEEVHVVEGGDAPEQHLGTGEPRAIQHERC